MSDRPRHSRRNPCTLSIRDIPERPHIQTRLIQLETTIFNTNPRNVKINHIRTHKIREREDLTPVPRLRLPLRTSRRLDHKTDDIPRHRTVIPDRPILRPLTIIQFDRRHRQPSTLDTTIPMPIGRNNGLNPISGLNPDQLTPIIHLNRAINMDPRNHIRHNTGLNPSQNQTINITEGSTSRPRLQPRTRSLTMRQTRIINRDHNIIITGRIRHLHSHRLRNGIRVRASPCPRAHDPTMRLDSDSHPGNRHQRGRTAMPDTLNATESGTIGREQERIHTMTVIISRISRSTIQSGHRMQNNITHKSFLTINHSDVDTPILPTKEDRRETSALSPSTSPIAS